MKTSYYLLRARDNAYWRPKGRGYTDLVYEAGVFDEQYARGVAADTHGEHKMVKVKSLRIDLNGKRALVGLLTVVGGGLFCFFGAKPEFTEAVTFIWCAASAMAIVAQWVVNGSHVE